MAVKTRSMDAPSNFLGNTNFLMAFTAVIVALIGGLNYFIHFEFTTRLEQRELQSLSHLLGSYSQEIESQLSGVDAAISALASTAASDRYTSREKHLLLNQTAEALDIVRIIGIVDADGRLIHSSRTFPAPNVNLSGRDYIDYFTEGGKGMRYLSGPTRNAVDNLWQIALSRPVRDQNGTLTGVITTVIDPAIMINRISNAMASRDNLTLLDKRFGLISRFPNREELTGSSFAGAKIYKDLAQSEDGSARGIYDDGLDKEIRLGVAKRVFEGALVLSTSRPYASAMAYWNTITLLISITSIVILILILFTLRTLNARAVSAQASNKELQAANERIEQERHNAENMARIKEEFLANMSHEIRTPMNAITGLSQLLERTSLSRTQHEYVRQIGLSGKFLLGIIDEILTFSKMESEKLAMDPSPYRLSDVIDNVGSIMAVAMDNTEIEVIIDVDPSLPEVLIGDAQRTKQILVNLASNAIKFTEKGSIRLSAKRIYGDDGTDKMLFEVSDTGIGIPEGQLDTIFDPFTQADTSAVRKYGGTGLGLAISKRLAECMDGQLTATSEIGAGSIFSLMLPCQPGHDAERAVSAYINDQNIRVLIIDDHEDTLLALASLAKGLGMSVETASSGKEGLATIKRYDSSGRPFDVVLVDWHMPDMDGMQTVHNMRHDIVLKSVPSVIMVTAYQREYLKRSNGNQDDVFHTLAKPVTGSTLYNAVYGALEKNQPHRCGPAQVNPMATNLLEGITILVAEDNPMNQQVARELLHSVGAKVEIAKNGIEALTVLEQRSFNIVLMDVQMPQMDGIEATIHIRKNPKLVDLPIIALTAGVLDSERRKCREAGMSDFIGKPFDFDIVVSKIRDTLGVRNIVSKNEKAQPPSGTDEVPLWDPHRALVLSGGRESLLKRLIKLYPAQARQQLDQLHSAVKDADTDSAARLLHSMQGSSSQIAAERVARLGKHLEICAREDNFQEVQDRISEFSDVVESTVKMIEEHFNDEDVTEAQPDLGKFKKLVGLLSAGNAEAIDEFNQIKPELSNAASTREVALIEKNIRQLEFSAALETLQLLKKRIN